MKKIIKLKESDLVNLVKKIVNEQNNQMQKLGFNTQSPLPGKLLKNSNFKVDAYVEYDMYMSFEVLGFIVKQGNIGMVIRQTSFDGYTDEEQENRPACVIYMPNKDKYFEGPIYDYHTKKQVFSDAHFNVVERANYQQLANKHKVPVINY